MSLTSRLFGGGEMIATLEWPDGRAFRGKVVATQVSIDQPMARVGVVGGSDIHIPQEQSWRMELQGIGDLDMTYEQKEQIRVMRTATEWKCDYCGAVMRREHRKCQGCGAFRSFLYEV